jgi:SAM-dependent methyltransferase
MSSIRNQHEIEHGRMLAREGAEVIWGWGSPAGKVRAERRAGLILSSLKQQDSYEVLELGCGTGDFTRMFCQPGFSLTAVDISEDLIDIASRNLADNPNVQIIHSSFESLPDNKKYAAVIGSSVLHHLEIKPALEQIHHLLKPGGVISFAEPNMLNPQIMIQKNIPWIKQKMGDSPDETAFFRWEIAGYLKEAGFQSIKVYAFDWLHPLIPAGLIPFVRGMGTVFEVLPLIKEFAGSLLIYAEKAKE